MLDSFLKRHDKTFLVQNNCFILVHDDAQPVNFNLKALPAHLIFALEVKDVSVLGQSEIFTVLEQVLLFLGVLVDSLLDFSLVELRLLSQLLAVLQLQSTKSLGEVDIELVDVSSVLGILRLLVLSEEGQLLEMKLLGPPEFSIRLILGYS